MQKVIYVIGSVSPTQFQISWVC